MKRWISHPTFYGNIVNKARKFFLNPHGLKNHLIKQIRKGYRHSIIIKSLNMILLVLILTFLLIA